MESVFQIASGELARVPEDWMPATGVRAFLLEDPALLWLDFHGEAHGFAKDTSPYEFTEFVFEKGRDFERKWIAELAGQAVRVCDEAFEVRDVAKLQQTLDLMERHVPLIAGPALWWAPEKVFGVPDLILHTSWLREHFPVLKATEDSPDHYVVFDMKFTTKLDSSQKKLSFANYGVQVRIYSYILGQLQRVMPARGFLACRDRITDPLEISVPSTVGAPLEKDLKTIRDKYLENKRQRQRVGSGNGAWDLGRAYLLLPVSSGSASLARPYPGLHPLPRQTVHAVLPHTAFQSPSA